MGGGKFKRKPSKSEARRLAVQEQTKLGQLINCDRCGRAHPLLSGRDCLEIAHEDLPLVNVTIPELKNVIATGPDIITTPTFKISKGTAQNILSELQMTLFLQSAQMRGPVTTLEKLGAAVFLKTFRVAGSEPQEKTSEESPSRVPPVQTSQGERRREEGEANDE